MEGFDEDIAKAVGSTMDPDVLNESGIIECETELKDGILEIAAGSFKTIKIEIYEPISAEEADNLIEIGEECSVCFCPFQPYISLTQDNQKLKVVRSNIEKDKRLG